MVEESMMSSVALLIADSRTPWSGDLVFRIECRSEAGCVSKVRHEIAIHDDWSISTPHDLDSERVAAAFGGYCSCVELVDHTLPLMYESLARVARRAQPVLRRGKQLEWHVPARELVACCSRRGYASVRAIAGHLRSPAHLAKLLALPLWQVNVILRNASSACRPDLGAESPSARFVREQDGLKELWQSGIHPETIPLLASYASVVDEPLPVSYFEGAVYSGHHAEWVNDVLQYRPNPDTAAWLVWQEPPDLLADAAELGRWLGYGVSRSDFLVAMRETIPSYLVMNVADATSWSQQTAARAVIDWARAGCLPTPQHFAEIARRGMDYSKPGREAIDLAMGEVRGVDAPIDRTELGVMLAILGNRPELVAAVRRGARNVATLNEGPKGTEAKLLAS
jgi:hypothetical protein